MKNKEVSFFIFLSACECINFVREACAYIKCANKWHFWGVAKKRVVWEFQGKYIIAHQFKLLKMFKMYMQKKTCFHKVTAGTDNHRNECLIFPISNKKVIEDKVCRS